MNEVFKDYATYYDLLYGTKDYKSEAEYIHKVIQANRPGARTILDLGCGTGAHAFELEKMGYEISGIDLSENMIRIAREKAIKNRSEIPFQTGDIRSFRTEQRFDVVISLFHVLSYQTSNTDVISSFETAAYHLNTHGVFIFDCWHGSGVLTDLPSLRHVILEDEQVRIHRVAHPVMYFNENCVDVNYTIIVKNKEHNDLYEVNETHKMRYFFAPELKYFGSALFSQHQVYGWEGFEQPSNRNWFIINIFRK